MDAIGPFSYLTRQGRKYTLIRWGFDAGGEWAALYFPATKCLADQIELEQRREWNETIAQLNEVFFNSSSNIKAYLLMQVEELTQDNMRRGEITT
jgi:hypothetical protein